MILIGVVCECLSLNVSTYLSPGACLVVSDGLWSMYGGVRWCLLHVRWCLMVSGGVRSMSGDVWSICLVVSDAPGG